MLKDEKIEKLIDKIGIQDDLREDLEQVQHQFDTMKEQVLFDSQSKDKQQIKLLAEKYEKDSDWFTQ